MPLRRLVTGSFVLSAALLASSAASDASVVSERVPSPSTAVQMRLHFAMRNSTELDRLIAIQGDPASPQYHHWLTPAQFRASFGPTQNAMRAAARALVHHGFSVTGFDSQFVRFSGSVGAVERQFGTQVRFARTAISKGRPAMVASEFHVPGDIAATGAQIMGLGAAIAPKPASIRDVAQPQSRNGEGGVYWFDDLKQAYQFPSYTEANGTGVTIGVINYNDYQQSDIDAYFGAEKVGVGGLAPEPTTGHLYFGGGTSAFDPNSGSAVEAALDVEQAGGAAPGSTVIDMVDDGYPYFMDAYTYADDTNSIDIVSLSYDECELNITPAYAGNSSQLANESALHDLYRQGNVQGITFIASSGDDAATTCAPLAYYTSPAAGASAVTYAPIAGVSLFSNDPNVTAVGGTNLETTEQTGSLQSKYLDETEFANQYVSPQDPNGTGNFLFPTYFGSEGGVSTQFKEPNYQIANGLAYSGRAVPDVSMHMGGCPHHTPSICQGTESGDELYFNGTLSRVLGTSASAPEFAGLLAVKESVTKQRYGNENFDLYLLARIQARTNYKFFHEGIAGYNGVTTVAAGAPGYNTITGLGSPIGTRFATLPNGVLAGNPQTLTNP